MAWDRFGNRIEEPSWSASALPEGSATASTQGVIFESEGTFKYGWIGPESDPFSQS